MQFSLNSSKMSQLTIKFEDRGAQTRRKGVIFDVITSYLANRTRYSLGHNQLIGIKVYDLE